MTDITPEVSEHLEPTLESPPTPVGGGEPTDKLVPVTEAIRYRKRAQTAEQQLDATRSKLAELRTQLDESQELIASLERRQKIDALLAESDTIDLDAARLLTERIVLEMSDPDVRTAVEDLRRHKPYLFRQRHARSSAAALGESVQAVDQVAAEARTTGDRRDLLRYLRLRRGS